MRCAMCSILMLSAFALAGCGQKGPLVKPSVARAQAAAAAQQSPAPAASAPAAASSGAPASASSGG